MLFFRPDLKIDVTLAIFHISGKAPILNEELNIAVNGLLEIFAASFRSFKEILSYPADLEYFSFFISFPIVFGPTG